MSFFDALINFMVGNVLTQISTKLAESSNNLKTAVASVTGIPILPQERNLMNSTLEQLKEQVAQTLETEKSAVVALNGVTARIDAAVAKALANGATAEQLAPVVDEIAVLKASSEALAAAIAAVPPPA